MDSKLMSNWWSMAINGVIALFYGILATFYPLDTLMGIITWFGIIIIVIGVAMLIGAISNIKNNIPYTTDLIWSILVLIVGLLLTFYTQRSVQIFFSLMGIWAIIVGVVQLIMVSKISSGDSSKNMLLANGVLTVVFGVLLIIFPITSANAVLVISGVVALFVGVILIVTAIKIRNLAK